VQMVAEVARRLGNTAAVCRKAYTHPDVLELGLSGDEAALAALWPRLGAVRAPRGLAAAEARLLRFLGEARRCRKDIHIRRRKAGGKYPASPT
jgi:DNA topoisomerase I